jgi:glyoxylase-like metal-dependent hydrolase (beta-lactamase superfamily II)
MKRGRSEMRVETITVGMFMSNCYLLSCERTAEAIIIDAGDEGERIFSAVKERGLQVKVIVNTHAHIDHVSGLSAVAPALSVPVLMHKDDMPIYENLSAQASLFGLSAPAGVKIDRFLEDGDLVTFGDVSGKVIHTPGHSPGGIALLFSGEHPQKIFCGDTLFKGSIGRTDLQGGDYATMMRTLEEVFLPMPDDTIVYPGHGEATTIQAEKRWNPFLTQLL